MILFYPFVDFVCSIVGYDPEIDGITYPTMRQAVIGVNVTF